MKKYRRGMQKDLSAIFDGVWIPQKTRHQRIHETATPTKQQQNDQPEIQAEAQTEAQAETQMQAEIETIMHGMQCSKDFECYRSGFEKLCRVRTTAKGKLIQCLEKNQKNCEFRLSFIGRALCKCRLRKYIAKNLNK